MRVAELFNRVLDLPGARVRLVEFEEGDHPRLVVHAVRPTRRVMACSGVGRRPARAMIVGSTAGATAMCGAPTARSGRKYAACGARRAV